MDCERIKELLITDYLDGEATEALKKEIDSHLRACDMCKEFKVSLEKSAIEPFENAPSEIPPESLWYNIKSAIEKERAPKTVIGIIDILAERLRPRRAILALATAAVIMIMVTVSVLLPDNRQRIVNNYLQEQMESLHDLNGNGEGQLADTGYTGFDTSIEEFFL